MSRKKIKSATDQRPFIIVYHDFLESNVIDSYEKMVFIALKKFADSKNQCFPSLKKLSDVTGLSKRKIQDTLKKLEQKHIITIESRIRADGGTTSNIYTLYDFKEIWQAGSSEEIENIKKKNFVDLSEVSTEVLLEEIKRRNNKEKGLESEPAKAQKQALELNQVNTIINSNKSQELERYTMQEIKEYFDYKAMINDRADEKESIDSVINIIYDVVNTRKKTIRINGEDKPAMSVQSKLMKLNYLEIMYCIDKFNEKTERIKNTTAYMLTLLYNAKERMHFDISNQVSHDMHK